MAPGTGERSPAPLGAGKDSNRRQRSGLAKDLSWHPTTLLKFKQRIRQLTNRNWGVSMKYQLFKTSQFIRGWINYYGIANCYQL
ncbi:group II intron maturase-specific domain-containing protein [Microbulbifer rhizosphaerae]|uniref:group II intron maturase-specific domain-containing protein n=1 Tax=Microbulbifer rhizosphaerae TaxID=1562603 RepID=UPI0031B64F0C